MLCFWIHLKKFSADFGLFSGKYFKNMTNKKFRILNILKAHLKINPEKIVY